MIGPVVVNSAELLTKLGVTFPPLDVFRNVAKQIEGFAVAGMLLAVGLTLGLFGLKIGIVIIAVASIYYTGMAIYNSLVKGMTKDTLPGNNPMGGPIYPDGKK